MLEGNALRRFAVFLFAVELVGLSQAVEECGDGYYCTWKGAYGCAKLPMGHDNPMVCCTAGEPEANCVKAGEGKALPYCPGGGASGSGCSRYSIRNGPDSDQFQGQTALEEECGDGYTCVYDGAYGCAKVTGGPMVCCSSGQPEKDCAQASNTSTPLPNCPAGGATGSGCVRNKKKGRVFDGRKDSARHQSNGHTVRNVAKNPTDLDRSFDEECGDGYTCTYEGAYGCAKEPITNTSEMVCCSVGQPEKYCAEASKTSTPLPYCPAGGATGTGCVRLQQRDPDETKNSYPRRKLPTLDKHAADGSEKQRSDPILVN